MTKHVPGASVAILVLYMPSKVATTGTDRPMYVLAATVLPVHSSVARKADHEVPPARPAGDRAAVLLFPHAVQATCRSTSHNQRSRCLRHHPRQSGRP